jgi:hypothetical protein
MCYKFDHQIFLTAVMIASIVIRNPQSLVVEIVMGDLRQAGEVMKDPSGRLKGDDERWC